MSAKVRFVCKRKCVRDQFPFECVYSYYNSIFDNIKYRNVSINCIRSHTASYGVSIGFFKLFLVTLREIDMPT